MVAAEDSQLFKGIAAYIPVQPDEIELKVNDIIEIKHTHDDGWSLCLNKRTNQTGLLPRNFLEQVSSTSDPVSKITASINKSNRSSSLQQSLETRRISALTTEWMDDMTKKLDDIVIDKDKALPSALPKSPEPKMDPHKKLQLLNEYKAARAKKVAASIGSLKILVVGDTAVGKSSLISGMMNIPEVAELCTDSLDPPNSILTYKKFSTVPVEQLFSHEDRFNITLVDSTGYSAYTDAAKIIRPTVDYLKTQFEFTDKMFVSGMPIPNLIRCHSHVDVCVYTILHRIKPIDLEFMRVLSPYTNIVPVLLKGDTLTAREVKLSKKQVVQECLKAGISLFKFGLSDKELSEVAGSPGTVPFSVSVSEGGLAGEEFDFFKNQILFYFIDDLRNGTSERFVNWRNVSRKSSSA